jgi:hypothetical protein
MNEEKNARKFIKNRKIIKEEGKYFSKGIQTFPNEQFAKAKKKLEFSQSCLSFQTFFYHEIVTQRTH